MVSSIVAGCICAFASAASLAQQKTALMVEQPGLCPPCLHDQMLRSLPASVEVVIAVNNGARQRISPAGKALAGLIEAGGTWKESLHAWRELAATLGWTPEKTFDELLGRRISLVARGLDSPQGPEWAVLSAVSGQAEQHLRNRLRASPRGAVVGLSVLAIEDGSFQFVVAPCPDATARGEDGSVILLAPRRCEALLDELAPALRSGAAPPAPSGKPCDVVLALRRAGDRERTLAITATARNEGWDASIVCARGLVLDEMEGGERIASWGDSAFRELEAGSLLTVVSVAMKEPVGFLPESVVAWKRVLSELASPGKDTAARTAVVVRSTAPAPAGAPAMASVRQVAGEGRDDGPRGALCITVAAETRDTHGTLVKGDLVMARFARLLMTGSAEAVPGGPRVQLEIGDEGPRSLELGEGLALHPDLEAPVSRAFGSAPVLNWCTVNHGGRGGWWVASMSPVRGVGAREVRALMMPETGVGKARLSIGTMRPAALARWMEAVQPEMAMPGAEFIESVRWDSWVRGDGKIEATVNVRMVGGR